jgi:hypothetical protein
MIETGILLAAAMVAAGGLLLGLAARKKQREHRELLEFLGRRNEEAEQSLDRLKAELEADRWKMADYARRIAWLETRIRKPAPPKSDDVIESAVLTESEKPKSDIAERRRRVLKLSSVGHDAESIAAALGMMRGEVELIIKLGRTR